MSNEPNRKSWIARCATQFEFRARLDRATAVSYAVAAYDGRVGFFDDDPEGAADEEMSRWNDGERS